MEHLTKYERLSLASMFSGAAIIVTIATLKIPYTPVIEGLIALCLAGIIWGIIGGIIDMFITSYEKKIIENMKHIEEELSNLSVDVSLLKDRTLIIENGKKANKKR